MSSALLAISSEQKSGLRAARAGACVGQHEEGGCWPALGLRAGVFRASGWLLALLELRMGFEGWLCSRQELFFLRVSDCLVLLW